VSLYPCSGCAERVPGQKYANVTIAWWTVGQVRLAYRAKLCAKCYAEHVLGLQLKFVEGDLTCPGCGIAVDNDMDPNYVTAFIPDIGRVRLELPMCVVCAVDLRLYAQAHGTQLVGRESLGGQDPGPQATGTDGWAQLGIYPRE
jgi:hypothetical protein